MKRPRPRMGTENDVVGKRVLAFLVDAVVVGLAVGILAGVFSMLLGRVGALLTPLLGLLGVVYFIYMEGTYGQTLGKRLLNVVVVDESGGDCSIGAAAIRNVLRLVDQFPGFYLVGFAVMYLVSDERQRVGDIVGDTVVVETA